MNESFECQNFSHIPDKIPILTNNLEMISQYIIVLTQELINEQISKNKIHKMHVNVDRPYFFHFIHNILKSSTAIKRLIILLCCSILLVIRVLASCPR